MKKILILASNPRQDLQLGYEIHALKNIIEESENLQKFGVIIDDAISPQNIQRLFLEHEPRIVHFCGHGSGINGLVFVDSSGKEQLVSTQALSNLFKEFDNTIECVLLNACYSEVQANEIVQHINYAIGMNQAIADDAAIFFAKGFYQALGKGKQIRQCFRLGKNAIELELSKLVGQTRKFEVLDLEECEPIPEHLKPTITIKSNLTLFSEDIARQKYIQANQEDFNLGKREQPTLNKQEYRFRQILLNKVRDSWIKGVLENSLHTEALLELTIQGRADLVHNPFGEYQELPVDLNSSYEWLQASNIFEQMGDGRTLLILGEPGAGKTIALLKLAKRFIEKTNNNLSLPIPVVFNLSSWSNKQKSIDEWLIIELKEKYQVSKSLAKAWIEQEQLLLLLDGLDEVKDEHRNACVIALNKFLSSHSLTEIVVCSRFQEYKALAEKLKLRSAIYIQPLTTEHINYYLRDVGEQLSGLKTLLQRDKEIEEFAKTPLILSIMSLTYQNYSSEDVLKQLSSPKNRYQNLFNSYIERMLGRKAIGQKYSNDIVLHWLSWLAKTMVNESQTIFLIEKLQPTLFQGICEKINYRISNTLLGGSIVGLIVGLTFGLLDVKTGLVFALSTGLPVGIFFFGSLQEITPFEQISCNWLLSWQRTKSRAIFGLILGLICMLIYWLTQKQITYELIGLFIGGIIAIPIDFVIDALNNSELEERTKPNQGIWLSRDNFIRLGLRGGLIGGLVCGILVFLITWLDEELIVGLKSGLIAGMGSAIIVGMIVGMRYGGAACIQHFNLRLIICCKGHIPWNYARFLDYASERLLMKKVGGGYIFYHPMLMEHFAQRN